MRYIHTGAKFRVCGWSRLKIITVPLKIFTVIRKTIINADFEYHCISVAKGAFYVGDPFNAI